MRTLICEFQPFLVEDHDDYIPIGQRKMRRKTGSPGRHYHYAYVGNKDVRRGDWALVHNGEDFGIVEIKRVVPGVDAKVTKHVIEVLTRGEFDLYKARNAEIDELRGALDELDYRLEQRKKLDKYEDLASEDPRSRELLTKLRGFFGVNGAQIEATSSTATSADGEGSEVRERTTASE